VSARAGRWRGAPRPPVPPGKAYSPALQAEHVVLLATDEYSLKPQLVSRRRQIVIAWWCHDERRRSWPGFGANNASSLTACSWCCPPGWPWCPPGTTCTPRRPGWRRTPRSTAGPCGANGSARGPVVSGWPPHRRGERCAVRYLDEGPVFAHRLGVVLHVHPSEVVHACAARRSRPMQPYRRQVSGASRVPGRRQLRRPRAFRDAELHRRPAEHVGLLAHGQHVVDVEHQPGRDRRPDQSRAGARRQRAAVARTALGPRVARLPVAGDVAAVLRVDLVREANVVARLPVELRAHARRGPWVQQLSPASAGMVRTMWAPGSGGRTVSVSDRTERMLSRPVLLPESIQPPRASHAGSHNQPQTYTHDGVSHRIAPHELARGCRTGADADAVAGQFARRAQFQRHPIGLPVPRHPAHDASISSRLRLCAHFARRRDRTSQSGQR